MKNNQTSDMEKLKAWLKDESKTVCENLKPSEYSDELAMIQKVQAVIDTIERQN